MSNNISAYLLTGQLNFWSDDLRLLFYGGAYSWFDSSGHFHSYPSATELAVVAQLPASHVVTDGATVRGRTFAEPNRTGGWQLLATKVGAATVINHWAGAGNPEAVLYRATDGLIVDIFPLASFLQGWDTTTQDTWSAHGRGFRPGDTIHFFYGSDVFVVCQGGATRMTQFSSGIDWVSFIPYNAQRLYLQGLVNWPSDEFRIALLRKSFFPPTGVFGLSPNAWNYYRDIATSVLGTSGALTGKHVDDVGLLSVAGYADDVVFAGGAVGNDVRGFAVLRWNAGSILDSEVVRIAEFGDELIENSGADVTVTWNGWPVVGIGDEVARMAGS